MARGNNNNNRGSQGRSQGQQGQGRSNQQQNQQQQSNGISVQKQQHIQKNYRNIPGDGERQYMTVMKPRRGPGELRNSWAECDYSDDEEFQQMHRQSMHRDQYEHWTPNFPPPLDQAYAPRAGKGREYSREDLRNLWVGFWASYPPEEQKYAFEDRPNLYFYMLEREPGIFETPQCLIRDGADGPGCKVKLTFKRPQGFPDYSSSTAYVTFSQWIHSPMGKLWDKSTVDGVYELLTGLDSKSREIGNRVLEGTDRKIRIGKDLEDYKKQQEQDRTNQANRRRDEAIQRGKDAEFSYQNRKPTAAELRKSQQAEREEHEKIIRKSQKAGSRILNTYRATVGDSGPQPEISVQQPTDKKSQLKQKLGTVFTNVTGVGLQKTQDQKEKRNSGGNKRTPNASQNLYQDMLRQQQQQQRPQQQQQQQSRRSAPLHVKGNDQMSLERDQYMNRMGQQATARNTYYKEKKAEEKRQLSQMDPNERPSPSMTPEQQENYQRYSSKPYMKRATQELKDYVGYNPVEISNHPSSAVTYRGSADFSKRDPYLNKYHPIKNEARKKSITEIYPEATELNDIEGFEDEFPDFGRGSVGSVGEGDVFDERPQGQQQNAPMGNHQQQQQDQTAYNLQRFSSFSKHMKEQRPQQYGGGGVGAQGQQTQKRMSDPTAAQLNPNNQSMMPPKPRRRVVSMSARDNEVLFGRNPSTMNEYNKVVMDHRGNPKGLLNVKERQYQFPSTDNPGETIVFKQTKERFYSPLEFMSEKEKRKLEQQRILEEEEGDDEVFDAEKVRKLSQSSQRSHH